MYSSEAARTRARFAQEEKVKLPQEYCLKERAAYEAVPVEGDQSPGEKKTRAILSPTKKTVCKLKKNICESLKHPKRRVYYCRVCDKLCPLCVPKCETCNAYPEMCWNHEAKGISYCPTCDEQCMTCKEEPEEELVRISPRGMKEVVSMRCDSCHNPSRQLEICSHGKLCSDCECEKCEECLLCLDYKRAPEDPHWVKFSNCECSHKSAYYCNPCIVDYCENQDGTCPSCRNTVITYPKCDLCKNYLGKDQEAIEYTCRGIRGPWDIIAPFKIKHRCHPECLRFSIEYPYRDKNKRKVFRCPCPHDKDLYWLDDGEVRVSTLTTDIKEKQVAEQSGTLQDNACHLCHQSFEEEEMPIRHKCKGFSGHLCKAVHKYHPGCLQDFVDNAAYKHRGNIVVKCPATHGYKDGGSVGNAKVLVNVVDGYSGITVPKRIKFSCSICNGEIAFRDMYPIDAKETATAAPHDCYKLHYGLFGKRLSDQHRYYVHILCLANHIIQKGREEEGASWYQRSSKKVVVYECPHHKLTRDHHKTQMPLDSAEMIKKLAQEK